MKLILFILFSLSADFLMAQDCRGHLLMQKGAQLEYKQYRSKNYTSFNFPDDFFPVLRMLFTVSKVKDSAGSTWSTIIKNGFSITDSLGHYARKINLQCDGRNLLFPYDFYTGDTLYAKDIYPARWRTEVHGYIYGYTPLADAISFLVPLALDCIVSLPEGKKQFEQIRTMASGGPLMVCLNRGGTLINISSINLEGKEMITTPAGTFPCYKFCVEEIINKNPEPSKLYLYLNNKIGLIKLEEYDCYIELNSIKIKLSQSNP